MAIPLVQTDSRELNQAQSHTQQAVKKLTDSPLSQGQLLVNIQLAIGDNSINHKLNKKLTGWFVTRIYAASVIYEKSADNTKLVLNSTASVKVDIFVF